MAASASRIAARSTTAGTPVKSCNSTRAGMKLISLLSPAAAPARDVFHVGSRNPPPVFMAQQVFQQNPGRKRQPRGVAYALFVNCRQPEISILGGAHAQLRRRAKTVLCHQSDYKGKRGEQGAGWDRPPGLSAVARKSRARLRQAGSPVPRFRTQVFRRPPVLPGRAAERTGHRDALREAPIAALDDGWRLVGVAGGEAFPFAARRPQ